MNDRPESTAVPAPPPPVPFTGEDVRRVRYHLGLTQHQLADRLGVTTRCVQFWERSRRRPHGPALVLLRQLGAADSLSPVEDVGATLPGAIRAACRTHA